VTAHSNDHARMLKMLTIAALLTSIVGPSLAALEPMSYAGRQAAQSLSVLKGQTGWITLGFVSPDRKRWVVAVDPTLDYFSGVSRYLTVMSIKKKPVLPWIGERIRLTVPDDVVIPDYANKGK
jgi:hypothetical protein